jgi:transcriptional regulator with XRE-family HTH domain
MNERILKILKNEGLTAAKFADMIGVQRSSISHIISGRNKPSFDFIAKTIERFPEINAEWLINGKGNVYKEELDVKDKIKGERKLFEEDMKTDAKEQAKTIVNSEKGNITRNEQENEKNKNYIEKNNVTNVTNIEKVLVLFSDGSFREYYKQD